MKYLRKFNESSVDIYQSMLDILSDIEDDGYIITGLNSEHMTSPHIEIYKSGMNDEDLIYSEFDLNDIKNCINHLLSFMVENGYSYELYVKKQFGSRTMVSKEALDHLSISHISLNILWLGFSLR